MQEDVGVGLFQDLIVDISRILRDHQKPEFVLAPLLDRFPSTAYDVGLQVLSRAGSDSALHRRSRT